MGMSDQYFIWLDPEAGDDACLVADEAGKLRAARLNTMGRKAHLIAFVPGTDVMAVPSNLGHRARKLDPVAAAFAIEDDLAADPATMHAAAGQATREEDSRFIYAAAKERMDEWVRRCRAFDVEQVRIVPEQSVIRRTGPALDLGTRICAWASDRPVAIEKGWPADVYEGILGAPLPAIPAQTTPLEQLAFAYLENGGSDLATGDYACQRRGVFEFTALRLPALLAASLLAMLALESVLATSAMNRLSPRIESRMAARQDDAFAQTAGGDAAAASGEMRELVAALYGAISETPDVRLKVLRYDGTDGTVRATLVFGELGQEQLLRSAVAAKGIPVVAGDLRTDEGGFLGDISLGGTS